MLLCIGGRSSLTFPYLFSVTNQGVICYDYNSGLDAGFDNGVTRGVCHSEAEYCM